MGVCYLIKVVALSRHIFAQSVEPLYNSIHLSQVRIDEKQTWTAGQVVIKSLLFLYFTRKVTKIMIHFVVLFSRQGKVRLQKWYEAKADTGGNKLL